MADYYCSILSGGECQLKTQVPHSKHWVSTRDSLQILSTVFSGDLARGRAITEFEESLEEHLRLDNNARVLVTNSGYSSLEIALHLHRVALGRSGKVLVPDITWTATISAIERVGFEPLIVDVSESGPFLSAGDLQKFIEPEVVGIVFVHFAGTTSGFREVSEIAKKHNLFLVEDAAHAFGANYKGTNRQVGSGLDRESANLTAFSFHPAKTITTGEGGALVVPGEQFEIAMQLRNTGVTRFSSFEYQAHFSSGNFHMDGMSAALGGSQLKRVSEMISRRRERWEIYRSGLEKISTVRLYELDPYSSFNLAVLMVPSSLRNQIRHHLLDAGYKTGLHYPPLSMLSAFKVYSAGALVNSIAYSESAITLPLFPTLPKIEIKNIVRKVGEICA